MIIKSAAYLCSNGVVAKCPPANMHEYAFTGRSNVGKSSLINMLTNRKELALISGKPGKTKTVNHFLINENWYLVDLPGYGFAKVSKQEKERFDNLLEDYVQNRTNLISLFILIDSRHAPQKIDLEFLEWLGSNGIPFAIMFTKIDKLSSSELNKNLTHYKKELLKAWNDLPPIFITSAHTGAGKTEVLNYIEQMNQEIPVSEIQKNLRK